MLDYDDIVAIYYGDLSEFKKTLRMVLVSVEIPPLCKLN